MKVRHSKTARRLIAACAAVCFAVIAGAGAGGAQPAPTNASLPELRARIDTLVNQPRFNAAGWSVKITSLDTGRTIYESHADRLMSPASNSKLYTGALALDTLGGDYRFRTPLFGTAKPGPDGTLSGALIVSGRGDPSWKAGSLAQVFEPFVTALRNAGVKVVTRDLVADTTFFNGPPTGGSWTVDDLDDTDGAEISALSLADNSAEIKVTPATEAGNACLLALEPADTALNLVNVTQTVPAGGRSYFEIHRATGTNDFYILGQMPMGAAPELLDVPVPAPARWFGVELKAALASHGISVQGGVRTVAWPEKPPWNETNLYKLGEVQSPPLRDLVHSFMKASQNLETDLVFDHIGELTRQADTSPWVSSEDLAVRALGKFLAQHRIPAEVHFDEGSGLSRNNLTSANATVALLAVMATNRWAADYYAALPVAGVDGTLRSRMKNTPAAGTVHAKTGTLRWANSLSGYVTTAAGERLAFSLMLNRYASPPDRRRTDEMDKIAVLLAGFKGRSDQ